MSKWIDLLMLAVFFLMIAGVLLLIGQAVFRSIKHPGE